MSVMHLLVRRQPNNTEPIKSKEELVFQCGFRRFRASPIFSQHTTGTSLARWTRHTHTHTHTFDFKLLISKVLKKGAKTPQNVQHAWYFVTWSFWCKRFLMSHAFLSADKHKMERFLRPDAPTVVTVYAPITFPPAGTLIFKQRDDGKMHEDKQLHIFLQQRFSTGLASGPTCVIKSRLNVKHWANK